jgi:hypothetical protein
MHSFEVLLGYESVDRTTFSTCLARFIENVLRSTLSYPNETSKECIQFLIKTILNYFRLRNPMLTISKEAISVGLKLCSTSVTRTFNLLFNSSP